MTLVNALDLLVIALWVLVGIPLFTWGFRVLHQYNRALKELEALLDERRTRRTS